MNMTGQTTFENTVWHLHTHKIQNTTEISHIFVHQYKFPNHDKVQTSRIVKICKNYSVIHIILSQNESFWQNLEILQSNCLIIY